jgi:hypothetical protein
MRSLDKNKDLLILKNTKAENKEKYKNFFLNCKNNES